MPHVLTFWESDLPFFAKIEQFVDTYINFIMKKPIHS